VKIKSKFIFILSLVFISALHAQVKFSLATDFSVLRNFDGQQPFTVFGQTLQGQGHIDKKNSFYTWFSYHSNGKYSSHLTATAKSIVTQPQTISFSNNSEMKLRQFSIGLKRYLLGSFKKTDKFNLYGAAGFGLIMGTASNKFSLAVDTLQYRVQNNLISGSGKFKRLSFDITGGWEIPVAYEIFVYSEARIHIPTTGYPNNYLLKNTNAPFTGSINFGLRILFNDER
jgi:hypothetical protein